jgi:hypothetical protein
MRSLVKGLALLVICFKLQGQPLALTEYAPILTGATIYPLGITNVPAQYNVGQSSHAISLSMNCATLGTVPYIVLQGSYDNSNWLNIGVPLVGLTTVAGTQNQFTGTTTGYGAFPYLRVNNLRAISVGSGCTSINVTYFGSNATTPGPTHSLSPYQDGVLPFYANNASFASASQLFSTLGIGSRFQLYGLTIHNTTTVSTTYTLTLYNSPSGTCTGGTNVVWQTFVLTSASPTISLGWGGISIYQVPNLGATINTISGAAEDIGNYVATTGSYQLCLSASASSATSVIGAVRMY